MASTRSTTTAGGIVYLLHFTRGGRMDTHYLGVAESEAAIDTSRRPHGHGVRLFPNHVGEVYVADVWEVGSQAEAEQLREKFRKQGSRKRICSVCNPGNSRGAGRGNWRKGEGR
jgi:hypothetical protein